MIGYSLLSRPNALFLCANSGNGFVSYTDEAFRPCTRLYVLKGGPGTGKSRFMEEVAKEAENRCLAVTRILCSSDPDSLDGILIPALQLGLTDGTAPHVTEPTLPGAREQLLDPGAFWDQKALFEKREEIKKLNAEKKESYIRALSLINGAAHVAFCQRGLLLDSMENSKVVRHLKRLLPKTCSFDNSGGTAFLSAIGMKGAVTLQGCLPEETEVLSFSPYFGAEFLLMERLHKMLLEKKVKPMLFKDPISLLPQALYLKKERLLIRCELSPKEPSTKTIDSKKYFSALSPTEKKTLRSLEKQKEALIESACLFFDEMKQCHFALEELYGDAMDFASLEDYKKEQTARIFT